MAIPSDITGLRIWLKADAITGLVNNDPVATWTDSSGNGFNVTQATGSKKPLYKTSILNGLPVVRFDGTDDELGTGTLWGTVVNSTISIYTVIALISVTSSAAAAATTYDDAALLVDNNGNIGIGHTRDVSGALTVRAFNWDGNEDFAALTGLTYGTWVRVAQDHDNVTLRTNANGGTFQTAASGAAVGGGNMSFGRNYTAAKFIAADVAEIAVWNKVLSSTEYSDMATYFDQKWISTPAGLAMAVHPRRMPLGV